VRAYSSDSVYTIQLVVKPLEQPAVSCKQTFNQLFSRFENRSNVCFHDTAGCSTAVVKPHKRTFSLAPLKPCLHDAADSSIGYPTALTTGCIVYTDIQPVEQPVECLYTRYRRLSNRLSNQLNNRLNNEPAASCKQTFNRLFNRFENRLYRVNGVSEAPVRTLV